MRFERENRKRIKKWVYACLSLFLVFTVSACAQTKEEVKKDAKVLVVYFSATGTTQDIAQKIANVTDGDLFEVVPKEKYTEEDLDYNNEQSRVCKEQADASLQNVELKTTKVKNWKSYDTVFIGYPIWWGSEAWPIHNFVKNNDFSNKTVIPFCTSASSGLGNSAKNLEEMANGGNWLEGKRLSSSASKSEIKKWVDHLNLN